MKIFHLLVFLLLFQVPAHWAQAQRFQAGLSAGFNLAQIDGDDLAGFNKPGLVGGLRVAAELSERWQLGMELLFSQQGAARSTKDPLGAPYDRIHLNVVEVPAMLLFSEWKLQLAAGLSYSYLINHRIRDLAGADVSNNFTIDNGSVNLLLGGTYFFQPQWGLDVRWTRGLMVRDVRSSMAGGQVDQFLSYFLTLRLIYLFN